MRDGILLGLLYNLLVVIGFSFISNVHTIKSNILKSSLILCIAGTFASVVILIYCFFDKTQLDQLKSLDISSLLQISIGAILILLIGEWLYLSGLSVSNITVMGYSALAYPAIALIVEIAFGRIELSSFVIKDFIGFAFCLIGSVLILSKT